MEKIQNLYYMIINVIIIWRNKMNESDDMPVSWRDRVAQANQDREDAFQDNLDMLSRQLADAQQREIVTSGLPTDVKNFNTGVAKKTRIEDYIQHLNEQIQAQLKKKESYEEEMQIADANSEDVDTGTREEEKLDEYSNLKTQCVILSQRDGDVNKFAEALEIVNGPKDNGRIEGLEGEYKDLKGALIKLQKLEAEKKSFYGRIVAAFGFNYDNKISESVNEVDRIRGEVVTKMEDWDILPKVQKKVDEYTDAKRIIINRGKEQISTKIKQVDKEISDIKNKITAQNEICRTMNETLDKTGGELENTYPGFFENNEHGQLQYKSENAKEKFKIEHEDAFKNASLKKPDRLGSKLAVHREEGKENVKKTETQHGIVSDNAVQNNASSGKSRKSSIRRWGRSGT